MEMIKQPERCKSTLIQKINAPLPLVWSMVGRFDDPKTYRQFVKSCTMMEGDGGPGSIREIELVSGFPAERSVERLEKLDEKTHVIQFSIIGGDERMKNYRSKMTLHEGLTGKDQTVVIESYWVDVPGDSNITDTRYVVDFLTRTNLKSLAEIAEIKMVALDFLSKIYNT